MATRRRSLADPHHGDGRFDSGVVRDVRPAPIVQPSRNVNAGDQLQINGTLFDGGNMEAVQPPLDEQTRQALTGQPIFLQANVADIQHVG